MTARKSAAQVKKEQEGMNIPGALNVGGQVMVPVDSNDFVGIPGGDPGDPNLIPQIPQVSMMPVGMSQTQTPIQRSDVGYAPMSPEDEEEIFPGGPPQGLVEMWKQQFGEVYSSSFGDETFIWRCLRRNEYKEVLRIQVKNGDTMFREESICQRCVLWPIGYSITAMISGKAGTPTLLAEQIMDKSGFVPTSEPERL